MKKLKIYNSDHHRQTNNLLLFLISLLGIIIFPAFGIFLGDSALVIFKISFTSVIFLGIYLVTNSKRNFKIGLLLGLMFLLFLWGENLSSFCPLLGAIASILFFGFVAFQIVRLLTQNSDITLNTIYGAITGYLLIGIIGGQLCFMIDLIQVDSFTTSIPISRFRYFYYSFVCLTTLGFGDVIPNNDAAAAISILIAITGQIYLTTLIAIIVGKYIGQTLNKEK